MNGDFASETVKNLFFNSVYCFVGRYHIGTVGDFGVDGGKEPSRTIIMHD